MSSVLEPSHQRLSHPLFLTLAKHSQYRLKFAPLPQDAPCQPRIFQLDILLHMRYSCPSALPQLAQRHVTTSNSLKRKKDRPSQGTQGPHYPTYWLHSISKGCARSFREEKTRSPAPGNTLEVRCPAQGVIGCRGANALFIVLQWHH